jgi:hypothetical protein
MRQNRAATHHTARLVALTAALVVPAAASAQVTVEQAFCNVVRAASDVYRSAEEHGANELQLSKLRSSRRDALKKAVKKGRVKDWLGVITVLRTNGDGDATIRVALPPCGKDVYLATWTIGLADLTDHTIIKQSSPLFDVLASLAVNTTIKLSGNFIDDPTNGFEESSLTESGSMTEPEFVFVFSAIAKP